mmetsp:Transcript_11096/g.27117  ORF Transcript_11096/g.27117 Transcript_11096/m.27117 type:complete len:252 (-) Transcript_11096:359-1114(-)
MHRAATESCSVSLSAVACVCLRSSSTFFTSFMVPSTCDSALLLTSLKNSSSSLASNSSAICTVLPSPNSDGGMDPFSLSDSDVGSWDFFSPPPPALLPVMISSNGLFRGLHFATALCISFNSFPSRLLSSEPGFFGAAAASGSSGSRALCSLFSAFKISFVSSGRCKLFSRKFCSWPLRSCTKSAIWPACFFSRPTCSPASFLRMPSATFMREPLSPRKSFSSFLRHFISSSSEVSLSSPEFGGADRTVPS